MKGTFDFGSLFALIAMVSVACSTAEPPTSSGPAAPATTLPSVDEASLPPMGAVTKLLQGTTPEAAAVRDDRVYVADVNGVSVYRIEPAGALTLVFHAETPGRASDVAIVGRELYVADGRAGLATFTLDDPDRPRLAGRTAFAGECSRVVGSQRGVAVLCTGGRLGLARPGSVLQHLSLPGEPKGAAWVGDQLYVADAGDGLVRIEIEPGPARVAYRDRTLHRALSMTAVGTRLFVGLRDKRVIALDASAPEPRVLGEVSVVNRPTRLDAGGTALLVASNWPGDTGATWLDISPEKAPVIIGRLPFSVVAGANAGASRWVVARAERGLSLLDTRNGGEVVAGVEGVRFERLAVGGSAGIAWTADTAVAKMWTLDSIAPLSAWAGSPIRDAVVCGNAWCALDPSGRVCRTPFDATPSDAPACVDVPEGGGSLAWQSNAHVLWVLDGNGGLHRLSLDKRFEVTASVPRAPMAAHQSLRRFVVEGELGVAIDIDLAIMHVFDLGSSPRRRGDYLLHSRPSAAALAGGFAFIAEPRAGLQIVDVSQPGKLREVAWLSLAAGPVGVAARQSPRGRGEIEVVLAQGDEGVSSWAFDGKGALVPLRRSDTAGFASDVVFARGEVWVADGTSILQYGSGGAGP